MAETLLASSLSWLVFYSARYNLFSGGQYLNNNSKPVWGPRNHWLQRTARMVLTSPAMVFP